MRCSCIQQDYDFELLHGDCSHILYQDTSDWIKDDGYFTPDTYDLTISSPTGSTVTVEVSTGSPTSLRTGDLDIPAQCLSDGIYTFSVTSCEYTYTKTRAVLCGLLCCLDDLISRSTPENLPEIEKIRMYITQADIQAKANNPEGFALQYALAKEMLASYNCKCKCV